MTTDVGFGVTANRERYPVGQGWCQADGSIPDVDVAGRAGNTMHRQGMRANHQKTCARFVQRTQKFFEVGIHFSRMSRWTIATGICARADTQIVARFFAQAIRAGAESRPVEHVAI